MNRNDYQNAFSKIEPSKSLVEAALSPKKAKRARRGVSLGTLLLAAAFAVVILAGTAFAAVHFQWFNLGGAEKLVEPAYDTEAIGKQELRSPDPQNLLKLEGESSESYIGFTLPASYLRFRVSRLCPRWNGICLYHVRNEE